MLRRHTHRHPHHVGCDQALCTALTRAGAPDRAIALAPSFVLLASMYIAVAVMLSGIRSWGEVTGARAGVIQFMCVSMCVCDMHVYIMMYMHMYVYGCSRI